MVVWGAGSGWCVWAVVGGVRACGSSGGRCVAGCLEVAKVVVVEGSAFV
jgi:hypothetical protein